MMEGSTKTVLILEDDEGVARLQQKRLQRAGYHVHSFSHPRDAMPAIRSGDVDLKILDYRLADQRTGLEFYEDLKRSGIEVPAILVTGFANESLIISALRAGMKDFVSKSPEYLDYLPEAVGRVLRQRQIERNLALQRRAMNAVSEGIVIADAGQPDAPLVFANDAFEKLSGYEPGEALGRNCRFLQGPETDRTTIAQLREAIRAGDPVTVEILNYRKDGRPFWNLLSVTPVRDPSGKITHFVGVQRDVTERKQVAEQLRQSQKLEAIGHLAGGIAHDFNNILTIMLGNTEMALEDIAKQRDCRELLHESMQAGQRAAALTRQLLAFSRRQVLEPKVLDLNAIVVEAQRLLRRLIGEDVVLTTSLDPALRKIKADPVQLEQILLNLTVNARDAMPHGGKLFIETSNVDLDASHGFREGEIRPGRYVMLAVSDTGHGMDAKTRARIFEPFFTTKERGRGTGMGLSTVYGIVQQSGGYVWVYSEVGHGTTFKIYLPESRSGTTEVVEAAPTPTTARGTETLLLVEDETAVRAIAKRMLESHGYRVLDAAGGEHALRIAEEFPEPIDLLVTDVIMPNMPGNRLAAQLRASRPETRVLYVSGYTDNSISHHGVLDEGVAFLQKPFSHETLSRKVREVLDAR
jgi:two-component system cell cycle sensor histidine kinase/response regulator CckA